ncbi:hypothetical protein BJ912DRAFT_970197 [Pholiota molesta]|nr:hypothetical protein BJ912DRAFT_970197 [Pholiota molesta]
MRCLQCSRHFFLVRFCCGSAIPDPLNNHATGCEIAYWHPLVNPLIIPLNVARIIFHRWVSGGRTDTYTQASRMSGFNRSCWCWQVKG